MPFVLDAIEKTADSFRQLINYKTVYIKFIHPKPYILQHLDGFQINHNNLSICYLICHYENIHWKRMNNGFEIWENKIDSVYSVFSLLLSNIIIWLWVFIRRMFWIKYTELMRLDSWNDAYWSWNLIEVTSHMCCWNQCIIVFTIIPR